MILSLQVFGPFGLGYSSQRGRGRGPRSGAASCSRSSAGGAAPCSSSLPSCTSSGRSPRGSRWLHGAAGAGEAIPQVGQTASHFTGDPCKARLGIRRDAVSIPRFTNGKSDFMGAQHSPQGYSAGEKGIRIQPKLTATP